MEPIKIATTEQIKSIEENSDLSPGCSVWSMGRVLGVVRPVVELDPIHFQDAPDRDKALFLWGMQNMLRANGTPALYFNIHASDQMARLREIVEKLGAKPTSTEPELRYKLVL
jgi:hypothetical protein